MRDALVATPRELPMPTQRQQVENGSSTTRVNHVTLRVKAYQKKKKKKTKKVTMTKVIINDATSNSCNAYIDLMGVAKMMTINRLLMIIEVIEIIKIR